MPPQPLAPPEKRRAHRLEPELQQPIPRRVSATRDIVILRWITLAGVLLTGIAFATGSLRFSKTGLNGLEMLVCLAGLVCLFWVVMEPPYWFARPFARTGTASVAVMGTPPKGGVLDALNAVAAVAQPGRGTNRLAYRYRLGEGEWREATRRVPSWKVGAWQEPGNTVTVLYDPMRPERHKLYPFVKQNVRVLPPARRRGES